MMWKSLLPFRPRIDSLRKLVRLGAWVGPDPTPIEPVGPECAHATVATETFGPATLVGVDVRLHVTRDGVTVRLVDHDGAICDHIYCVTLLCAA